MKPYRAYGESAGPGGPNAQKLLSVDDFERESITRRPFHTRTRTDKFDGVKCVRLYV